MYASRWLYSTVVMGLSGFLCSTEWSQRGYGGSTGVGLVWEEVVRMPVSVVESVAPMDVHEVVRRMNNHIGATLVAVLAGSRDSKLPYHWAESVVPDGGAVVRIRMAYRVWSLVADAESDHVARLWFVGANPVLGGVSPVMALREDRLREVCMAAQVLVDDSWTG